MAREYHNLNAISMADANWAEADGTPGSGFANEADLVVQGGHVPIVNDLDHSDVIGGVNRFAISRERTGPIATQGSPMKFDVDGGTNPVFFDYGSGDTNYKAEGDTNLCKRLVVEKAGATFHAIGGEFELVEHTGGGFHAHQGAELTTYLAWGGRSVIEPHATPMTLCRLWGGHHEIRRSGKIVVDGPALVKLDIAAALSANTELEINDSRAEVVVYDGAVPILRHHDGLFDVTQARRDLPFGATTYVAGPPSRARLRRDDRHTFATPQRYGGGTAQVGGATGTTL